MNPTVTASNTRLGDNIAFVVILCAGEQDGFANTGLSPLLSEGRNRRGLSLCLLHGWPINKGYPPEESAEIEIDRPI
jgi:hypothetical protein